MSTPVAEGAQPPRWRKARRALAFWLMRPWVRYVTAPVLVTGGGVIDSDLFTGALWTKVCLIAVGLGLSAGGSLAGDRVTKSLARWRTREDAQNTITRTLSETVITIESCAVDTIAPGNTLRASVALVHDGYARIAYYAGSFTRAERDIAWAPGQGPLGRCLELSQSVLAPEADELPVRLEDEGAFHRPWNMSADQVRMWANKIASVFVVPLETNGGLPRGLLILDDQRRLGECPLAIESIRSLLEHQIRDTVTNLLTAADWLPPTAIDRWG